MIVKKLHTRTFAKVAHTQIDEDKKLIISSQFKKKVSNLNQNNKVD